MNCIKAVIYKYNLLTVSLFRLCDVRHVRDKHRSECSDKNMFSYFIVFSIDTDECTAGTHRCDTNSTCINFDGSYTCKCNSGYNGDGFNCTGKEYNSYPRCSTRIQWSLKNSLHH